MNDTLYRSRENALLGGVCGGIGDFLGFKPTVVRVCFVLLAFGSGVGLLLYLLLWLIIPLDGQVRPPSLAENVQAGSYEIAAQTRFAGDDLWQMLFGAQSRLGVWVGAVLIGIGVLYLAPNLDLQGIAWLDFDLIWPILLIIGGLALLLRRPKGVNHHGRSTKA